MTLHDWVSLAMQAIIIACLIAIIIDQHQEGPAVNEIMVGPHDFQRLSWRHRRKCRACYLSRDLHPTGWTTARPIGDTSGPDDTDWNASPALIEQLQQLGSQYGPLGVAIAAARLTDSHVLVRRLLHGIRDDQNTPTAP